jgi:hypothetical protein
LIGYIIDAVIEIANYPSKVPEKMHMTAARTPSNRAIDDASSALQAGQSRVQRLTALAAFLEPSDADLVIAVLVRGERRADIAARVDCSPGNVSRRFRALVRRLESRPFVTLIEALPRLPQPFREFAEHTLVRRRPIRYAAMATGFAYHDARFHARTLRLWHRLLMSQPDEADSIEMLLTAGSTSTKSFRRANAGGASNRMNGGAACN